MQLVYVSLADGRPTRASLEVLTRCRELEDGNVEAVVLATDPSTAVEELGRFGARKVHTVAHPSFASHLNTPITKALVQVIEETKPTAVVMPSTEGVKDVLGAVAARLGAPVLPDVSDFEMGEGEVSARRPVIAAKFLARVSAKGKPVLVSVRSGSFAASEAPVQPEVREVSFEYSVDEARQTLREVVTAGIGTVDLAEARVVVAAGRGVRDEQGKQLVDELAEVTGAAIGSTRALVESGMFDDAAQIGQTGKVVSPELYFAVGLSGAVQHTAGMTNSRIIVAINRDPDAPIFKIATYGLVGDLYEILPALIDEIRSLKG